jgi:alkylated DNA repair dioxygenase AlkB
MDLFDTTNNPILPFSIPKEDGFSGEWDERLRGFKINIPHGELFYSKHFFNQEFSDSNIKYFLENNSNNWQTTDWKSLTAEEFQSIGFKNIKWKQDSINLYGKNMLLPRITSWFGDTGKSYSYSGINSNPNEWNAGLVSIKNSIEEVAGVKFNSVLMNWYRDGEDHLNWHADDEKELGVNPIIASVNFGATRDFVLRRNDKSSKINIPLNHGTLLIMKGECQHYWQHSVPKRKKVKDTRINLTFRFIKN